MKKEGNFSKAFDELLSGTLRSGERSEAAEATLGSLVTSPGATGEDGPGKAADSLPGGKPFSPKPACLDQAVITQDMVIKGSVTSTSNILMEGSILGDVTCEGDISVKGKIEGKVHVRSLSLQGGTVQGDVESTGTVLIGEESKVNGNIKGGHIDINGSVVGDIASTERVTLNPKAVVEGNITATGLSMFDGAELKGSVDVHKPA
ncbi:MAG: polymer-forming cytoskeletal protein [Spirochaetes bacterium]|nr:polymer-forming cytoskeletal protein [Spirochaetota bacterium]